MTCRSDKETMRPETMVLLNMYNGVHDNRSLRIVKLRIEATIYNSQKFLGSFKLPIPSFTAPVNCLELRVTAIIAKKYETLAISSSDVLAQELTYLFPVPPTYTEYILRFKYTGNNRYY
jgi:hypothetical protein